MVLRRDRTSGRPHEQIETPRAARDSGQRCGNGQRTQPLPCRPPMSIERCAATTTADRVERQRGPDVSMRARSSTDSPHPDARTPHTAIASTLPPSAHPLPRYENGRSSPHNASFHFSCGTGSASSQSTIDFNERTKPTASVPQRRDLFCGASISTGAIGATVYTSTSHHAYDLSGSQKFDNRLATASASSSKSSSASFCASITSPSTRLPAG